MPAPSLLELLQQVPDPRSRRGRSYPLAAVLALLVLGLLMGRRSLTAIAQLVPDYGGHLALLLGFPRTCTPCVSALSWLLRRLDAPAFEHLLSGWIRQAALALPPADAEAPPLPGPAPAGPTPVHLDGKTLRGSRDPGADLPGVHLLAAFAPRVQAVLAQLRVDSKTNEHKAALELLNFLPPTPGGHLVTGDAIFCQKEVCQKVIDRQDHYLLTAKDNQPGLVTAINAGLTYAETARSFSP
jgi:DDE_Tnp_1-associated/Transposase DDE domain